MTTAQETVIAELTEFYGRYPALKVHAVEYQDGSVAVDKLMNLGQVHSSPVATGNLLVFGATDGNVYALQG